MMDLQVPQAPYIFEQIFWPLFVNNTFSKHLGGRSTWLVDLVPKYGVEGIDTQLRKSGNHTKPYFEETSRLQQ